jgi:hypothetical protein
MRRCLAVIAVLLAVAGLAAPAAAQTSTTEPDNLAGIGVAPSFVTIDEALRGTSYTDSIILANNLPGDREFTFVPTGDIAGWATFTDQAGAPITSIVIPHRGATTLQVIVAIPDGTANGRYEGRIEITGRPIDDEAEDVSAAELSIGAVVAVAVDVGGEMRRAGTFDDVRVEAAEVGMPLRIVAAFNNTGNVGFAPALSATVTRAGQPVDVVAPPADEVIDPGRAEDVVITWDTTDTLPGEYQVEVVATADGFTFEPIATTFRLEPAGSVERAGALESFEVVNLPEVGNIARVRGEFRNDSDVAVSAILVAEVTLDGQLVDEVRSLELMAPPGNVTSIDVVVDDLRPGTYEVAGKVNFEGLETDTLTTTFVVAGEGTTTDTTDDGGSGLAPGVIVAAAGATGLVVGVPLVLAKRRKRPGRSD